MIVHFALDNTCLIMCETNCPIVLTFSFVLLPFFALTLSFFSLRACSCVWGGEGVGGVCACACVYVCMCACVRACVRVCYSVDLCLGLLLCALMGKAHLNALNKKKVFFYYYYYYYFIIIIIIISISNSSSYRCCLRQ